MSLADYELRIKALAERSSYVENVLRHAFIAEISSVLWDRNPATTLQIFNSEVDDSGLDLVLGLGPHLRYVQLKQTHDQKIPITCSVRLAFSARLGSSIVLMSYSINDLRLSKFHFFGGSPGDPMPNIEALKHTKLPRGRDEFGKRKLRANYRDIPVRLFEGPMSSRELVEVLFPQ